MRGVKWTQVLEKCAAFGLAKVLLGEIGSYTPHMLEIRHLGAPWPAQYNIFTSAYPGPGFAAAVAPQTAFYERLSSTQLHAGTRPGMS